MYGPKSYSRQNDLTYTLFMADNGNEIITTVLDDRHYLYGIAATSIILTRNPSK